MRILHALTYYRPHISGLTIYVERLARGLVRAGHEVTVLTSQFDRALPLEEIVEGVRVIRVPVIARLSKGVIMPTVGQAASRLMADHDLVHLHLPQFDGAGLALRAKLARRPVTLTYHCDIELPRGVLNAVAQPVIHLANHIAARWTDTLVAYTDDYARHSPFLSRYLAKLKVIPPPVEIGEPTAADLAAFRQKFNLSGGPVIGMAARLATEKGVEVLVNALEIARRTRPDARVLFAGPYQNVLGEAEYARRLQPHFDALGPAWTFTGSLRGPELAAFFASLDVHVLPSLNSTESFGLVQVEAMLCGTPCVCSDLPGVRVSVQETGMGEVAPIGDAAALAAAIERVIANRTRYVRPRSEISARYSTERSVVAYTGLYEDLLARHARK
ncbi:MAG TPA: glycosyltransferase family 4 protein [Thermoflexales bacterium]|nr:glycosyltransferase family 4 protein [Thermoflexales bacterium]HQX10125.1 glycosyltransferase family 4 protein [Thermoflexales bacterium]HQY24057.1 glycosyltransferase family 4 protein [Thermoflexales bacterium]HQZ52167.1 glycosyltransferase family 4 protein [Thermoflexales bacterium]HRA53728.1 glycosyltransferase family 4 protein [Thermoflexales bacterium]